MLPCFFNFVGENWGAGLSKEGQVTLRAQGIRCYLLLLPGGAKSKCKGGPVSSMRIHIGIGLLSASKPDSIGFPGQLKVCSELGV